MLAPTHFAHVDQTFYAGGYFYECTVVGHYDNLTVHFVANLEVGVESIPGMRRKLLQSECNALLLFVEIENYDVKFLVELDNFVRIVHATPAQVGNVYQTIHATEVNECAVGCNVLDGAFKYLTLLELRNDFLLLCFEFCLNQCLVTNYYVLIFLVDFDNLEFHRLSNEYVVVANGLQVDLATGQECLNTEYVDNHTTLGAALYEAFDDFLVFEGFVYAIPCLAQACLLVRQDKLAALVLLIFDIYLYGVANLKFGVVAELAYGHDTVALEANAYDNFAFVNGDDLAFYYFVFVYLSKRFGIGLFSLLLAFLRFERIVLIRVPIEVVERLNVFVIYHKIKRINFARKSPHGWAAFNTCVRG